MKSLDEIWHRIIAWHDNNTYPGKFRLQPGATEEQIRTIEDTIDQHLPEDVRDSFLVHNGGYDSWLLYHGELLSIEGLLEQWEMYTHWQTDEHWGLGEEWRPFDIEGPIKPIWWNPKRIPLTDNSGDHIMIDLDPPENGKYGQVLEHDHEVGPTRVLADSWYEWLRQIANDLEAGKYIYVEEEDIVALPGMYN